MRLFLLLSIIIFSSLTANAQKKFNLLIELDRKDVQNVYLSLPLDSVLYEKTYAGKISRENDNTFHLKGKVNFPYLYELLVDSLNYSQTFVVYPGENKITLIKIGNEYKVIRTDKHIQDQNMAIYTSWFENEYSIYDFLKKFDPNIILGEQKIANIRDSLLTAHYNRTDSVLYLYTKNNPKSYYSLWFLNRLLVFGYTPLMEEIFHNFDNNLQSGHLGRLTLQKINSRKTIKEGNVIPDATFEDTNGEEKKLHDFISGNKLTWVNFWYSDCGPCLIKIPKSKEILSQYQKHGFNIINISIDKKKDITKWKDTIRKHDISWLNLLDTQNLYRNLYGIEAFPFSFLVDNNGLILSINPSDSEVKNLANRILNN